ncbi:MAG: hypothetical protein FWG07_06175 [Treponema sp.]|nr:hypothetical protein [Treponema sp.]
MNIKINGKPADITLENEKTIGEVLAGIHQWLEGLGFSVSGLEIDGKSYGSLSLDAAMALSIDGISDIDIKTSGWADLLMEALTGTLDDLDSYEKTDANNRKSFAEHWKLSAPALFLKDQEKVLFNAVIKALEDASYGTSQTAIAAVISLVTERIREIKNPIEEMKMLHPLTEEIAKKLEDLPLDMQTGKDGKAAETITIFSSLVEKIFRLIFLFNYYKTDIDSIGVPSMNGSEKQNLKDYIGEFSAALKELISAFENKDTVLVGDLAEYELAPRLRCLSDALNGVNPGVMP